MNRNFQFLIACHAEHKRVLYWSDRALEVSLKRLLVGAGASDQWDAEAPRHVEVGDFGLEAPSGTSDVPAQRMRPQTDVVPSESQRQKMLWWRQRHWCVSDLTCSARGGAFQSQPGVCCAKKMRSLGDVRPIVCSVCGDVPCVLGISMEGLWSRMFPLSLESLGVLCEFSKLVMFYLSLLRLWVLLLSAVCPPSFALGMHPR